MTTMYDDDADDDGDDDGDGDGDNDYEDGSQYGYRLSCREDPPKPPQCEPSVANLIGALNP